MEIKLYKEAIKNVTHTEARHRAKLEGADHCFTDGDFVYYLHGRLIVYAFDKRRLVLHRDGGVLTDEEVRHFKTRLQKMYHSEDAIEARRDVSMRLSEKSDRVKSQVSGLSPDILGILKEYFEQKVDGCESTLKNFGLNDFRIRRQTDEQNEFRGKIDDCVRADIKTFTSVLQEIKKI